MKKKQTKIPTALIFWMIFFIGVTGVFLFNRETIKKNFGLLSQRLKIPASESPLQDTPAEPDPSPQSTQAAPAPQSSPQAAPQVSQKPVPAEEPKPAQPTTAPTVTQAPAPAAPADKSATSRPAAQQPATPPSPTPKPAETKDRTVYFTHVDKDGQILRSKVTRKLTVSDSPMLDSLNALLAGPSPGEKNRGVVSLIPANTRVLTTTVRGSTAYINFSEDFQYNTYGVEGYAAQLKQIVWTVTEFPNIKDVQILVEGKRIDYLGEGIWIGSPIGRE